VVPVLFQFTHRKYNPKHFDLIEESKIDQ